MQEQEWRKEVAAQVWELRGEFKCGSGWSHPWRGGECKSRGIS